MERPLRERVSRCILETMKAIFAVLFACQFPACGLAWSGDLSSFEIKSSEAPQVPEPSGSESQDEYETSSAKSGWSKLAAGAWMMGGSGSALLIAFPGYSVQEAGAKNWAAAVAKGRDYGGVVTLLGPNKPGYSNDELNAANKALVKKIRELRPSAITIVAHSSGGFVANEFFSMFGGEEAAGKTAYYNLDGAFCSRCASIKERHSGFAYKCVSARQGNLVSPNAGSSKRCGSGHYKLVDASSGCSGKWCLHAWLINRRAAKINADRPGIETYYRDPDIKAYTDYLD